MKQIGIVILTIFIALQANSQNYIPGQVYYGTDSLIEYRCGNLPIILSSPHGGYDTPGSLPDRNCIGCATGRDSYTQELTRQVEASIFYKTGCRPHVIINKLHRIKLDANREIIEATDSNLVTEPYWHDYMNFIDTASNIVSRTHTKGLFFDIHGHAHTIQRLEIGLLLNGTNLRLNDSALNSSPYNTKTSILRSRFNNLNSYSHAEMVRGEYSFGSMIQRKGYPAVPSDSIPAPLVGEPYFGGGYNTVRFGSRNGGTIDAIQIESHQSVRFTSSARIEYADSLATAILEYMDKHYFANFSQNYCEITSIQKKKIESWKVYPNPTNDILMISGITKKTQYSLFNINGQLIVSGNIEQNEKIDMSDFPSGLYIIKLKSESNSVSLRIIKE